MNFNRIQAAEVKIWDFSAYFLNTPRICKFFSDFLCSGMSLLFVTVTLRGVSNKHCLLSLFSFVQMMTLTYMYVTAK